MVTSVSGASILAGMTFRDWLNEKMKATGLGVNAIARELTGLGAPTTPGAVSRWWKGTTVPNVDRCGALATLFGEHREVVEQLAGHRKGEAESRNRTPEEAIRMLRLSLPLEVPVEGLASAGPGSPREVLYYDRRVARPTYRAFEVTGDCLDELTPGDRVVIDTDVRPREGDIVVAEREGDRIIKKFYGDEFRSVHGSMPVVGWNILGPAVEIRRPTRRSKLN